MSYDWYSSDDANKKIRRAAADDFLNDVFNNTNGLGDAVTGLALAKKKRARAELDQRLQAVPGGGPLPAGVEVICVEGNTHKMAELVVFVLKSTAKGKTASHKAKPPTMWRKCWVAAWVPY
jgi:hypothetical protein